MTKTCRNSLSALAAAAALFAAGCGGTDTCSLKPDVASTPSSCDLRPSQSVSVQVRWCSCGSSTSCDVIMDSIGSGIIQLEPVLSSCDTSCQSNPASCDTSAVTCTFTAPAAGDYTIYVGGASGTETVPLTVSAGGTSTCT